MTTKKQRGPWRWNSELLWSKVHGTDPQECWHWLGARGPQTNLMGAQRWRDSRWRNQMTQAHRLLYQDLFDQDATDLSIKHTCGNRFCCNPHHFKTTPNLYFYRADGTLKSEPPSARPGPELPQFTWKPL